jgi:hypothetical protein
MKYKVGTIVKKVNGVDNFLAFNIPDKVAYKWIRENGDDEHRFVPTQDSDIYYDDEVSYKELCVTLDNAGHRDIQPPTIRNKREHLYNELADIAGSILFAWLKERVGFNGSTNLAKSIEEIADHEYGIGTAKYIWAGIVAEIYDYEPDVCTIAIVQYHYIKLDEVPTQLKASAVDDYWEKYGNE